MSKVGTSAAGKVLTGAGTTSTSSFEDLGTNSSLTSGGIVLAQGDSAFVATSQPTNGQLLIGATGSDPVLSTLTAGTGIEITNASASITLTSPIAEFPVTAKTATYTVTSSDYFINCTANSFTVTLPKASDISGKVYDIKNSGSGTITIEGDGSETIDGDLNQSLIQDESMTLISNGSNWFII